MTQDLGRSVAAAAELAAPLIEVDGLTVSFPVPGGGRRTVVEDVSLAIPPGTVLALVGESGSGKSVTSRSLVGLAGAGSRVSARTLRVTGHDVLSMTEKQWRRIRGREVGFVLQDALASLDNLRRVGAEVAEPLRLHTELRRSELDQRVLELLAEAGIPDPAARVRQYPFELSGGLRQRALIASAIGNHPSVLVADEPTTALDATVAAQILRLLGSLVRDDGALLMISHDLAAVASIADTIAVMHAGRIVESGPADQVLHDPRHAYTKKLLAAVPSAASRGQRLSADPPRVGARAQRSPSRVPRSLVPSRARARVSSRGRGQNQGTARPPEGAPPLEVRNVVKRYPGGGRIARTVVDDVSFALRHGETLGIVGESGSGKTTVARIALGVEKPDTGQALVGGRQWDAVPRGERSAARREVQLIAQDPLASFDPRYTVAKVLGEPLNVAGFRGADARQRARELLDLVRLPDTALASRPLELSGGQRQRVAIARALAVEPTVIVADEPVSALDVSVQAQILDLFADVQREFGVSYLFISHDLGVMHHVADRVLVLSGGRVVEEGEIEAVFTSPQHSCTRELLAAIPRLDAARGGQQEIGRP